MNTVPQMSIFTKHPPKTDVAHELLKKNTFPLVYPYTHMYKISFILIGSINQKYCQRMRDK